jgi:CheY-like chemotaxis protein
VDTEEGRGTSFHIYLPAASAGASGERRPHPAAAAGGSEAILVAEDEPMVREMVRNTLERLGYQVRLAADGREALELLRSGQHCDLLLLDMVMPHMGGYEVFEHARAIGLRIPVVFMTGHSVELAGHRFGSDTQALFIQKPFRMEELGRQVRRALEGRPV